MKKGLTLSCALLIILGMILSACASQVVETVEVEVPVEVQVEVPVETIVEVQVTPTPLPERVVPAEMQVGGDLRIWLPSWTTKSWFHFTQWEDEYASEPIREVLFYWTPSGLEPSLATGYEISDDHLTYTINLRDDVNWHDGEPLTVDDVIYTFEMFYHPNKVPRETMRFGGNLVGLAEYNSGDAEEIEGLVKVDDHTFQLKMINPDVSTAGLWFRERPFNRLVPKHILETLDQTALLEDTSNWFTTNPVGLGPYKFVQYAQDQYIEYERNEDYFGGAVGPDRLFLIIATADVALVMLQNGELDLVNPVEPAEAVRIANVEGLNILEGSTNRWYGFDANRYTVDGSGFWMQPDAMKAFLYSIDRQAYVDSVLDGYGTVVHSFWDNSIYACPDMVEYNYDPVKADELWTELIGDKDARAAWDPIDMMAYPGIKARTLFLPVAQEYLRAMGFIANVDLIDNSTRNDYRAGGGAPGANYDFQILMYGPDADPAPVLHTLLPEGTGNPIYWPGPREADGQYPVAGRYINEEMEALIRAQAEEFDFDKRVALIQQADCIYNQELPHLPIVIPSALAATSDRLQGVDWATMSYFWNDMYRPGDWWVWEE